MAYSIFSSIISIVLLTALIIAMSTGVRESVSYIYIYINIIIQYIYIYIL